jgi:hypothetical protein
VDWRSLVAGYGLATLAACAAPEQHAGFRQPQATSPDEAVDAPMLAKRAGAVGYHVEVLDGARRYCRSVTPVNSHIPHKECRGESEMIAELGDIADQNSQRAMRSQGQGSGCFPPPCKP